MILEQIAARKVELTAMFKRTHEQIAQLQEQATLIRGAFLELSEQEGRMIKEATIGDPPPCTA